jgi:hypothetical protein
MDGGRAEDQVRERRRVDVFNFLERPVVTHEFFSLLHARGEQTIVAS